MSKKRRKGQPAPGKANGPRPNDPVDVADGIVDRSERCRLWRYALVGAVFVAWVALLVYCQIAATTQ